MSNYKLSEVAHFSVGIAPVADFADSTQYSDVVNFKNYGKVTFVVFTGAEATGTQTLTVQACDDVVPTTRSAVEFYSRSYANSDVPGALTARAAAGFLTTAGANQVHVIEVDAEALIASGYSFVQLKSVEGVNSPVTGAVLVILSDPKSTEAIGATAIV